MAAAAGVNYSCPQETGNPAGFGAALVTTIAISLSATGYLKARYTNPESMGMGAFVDEQTSIVYDADETVESAKDENASKPSKSENG